MFKDDDRRHTLKTFLAVLKENLVFLRGLPAIPMHSCAQTLREIRQIKKILGELEEQWMESIDKKGKDV